MLSETLVYIYVKRNVPYSLSKWINRITQNYSLKVASCRNPNVNLVLILSPRVMQFCKSEVLKNSPEI